MFVRYQLLVCLVLALATSSVFAQQDINITSTSSSVINGEDFEFSCASPTLNLTDVQVLINGVDSNSDQLTRDNVNSSYVEFSYAASPEDNGVKFQCSLDNRTHESANLTLTVFYITFNQKTSNFSLWQEFLTGSSFSLNCTAQGNPDNITITPSNTTKNFSNVEFAQRGGTLEGGFTFTDALVDNGGTYTCTASNGLVSDNITYQVFVGGPPANVNITQIGSSFNSSDNGIATLSFTIIDSSDAPARGVLINVPGVESNFVTFSDPIRDSSTFSYTLSTELNAIAPSVYNVTFTPINRLGNGSTLYYSVLIPGQDFTVNILTSNTTLPEQSNFTIICSTNTVYLGSIELYINGRNSSNFSNVVQVEKNNMSVSFVFMSVQPSDLGSTFACVGRVSENTPNRTSETVSLNVLYAPRFQEFNNVTQSLDYAINSSFTLNCTLDSTGNPPSAGFRYINTTKEFSNVNTTLSNTSLSYLVTDATVSNRVNLTCVANSSYATTTFTYLAFVGGPPNKITVVPVVSVQSGIVYLSLNIMDESDAPARSYMLVISDIYNYTISNVQPIVNQTFSDLLGKPVELFGDSSQYLSITAMNNLGTTAVYHQILDIPVLSISSFLPTATSTFTAQLSSMVSISSLLPSPSSTQSPTSEPVDNLAGFIALGVIVPLVLLLIGIFGVATFFYLYRNRKTKGLTNFIALKDSSSESVSYSSRRVSGRNRRTQYSALA